MTSTFLFIILTQLPSFVHASEVTDQILKCEAALLHKNSCADSSDREELKKLCANPVDYVCKNASPNGALLTSACKLTQNGNQGASQIPEVSGLLNQIQEAEARFVQEHQGECTFFGPPCPVQLKEKYVNPFKLMTLNTVYTPERVDKLNRIFDKVKNAALALIDASQKLTPLAKTILKKRIDDTSLRDPMKDSLPDCYFMGPNGAETGVYNEPMNPNEKPKISVCLGAMAMLEREDEASVMITLGHELTHSIDPCTLDALASKDSSMQSGEQVYSDLLGCLRGGVLHQNAAENAEQFCKASIASGEKDDGSCEAFEKKAPNCSFYTPAEGENEDLDLSHYRSGPGEINQMAESFSDFFSSEIYAKVLQQDEKKNQDKLGESRRRQILTSLGADFASLHGICLLSNTYDVHPPGSIRVLNNILGNKEFGRLVCPKFKGKQCSGL